MSIPCWFHHPKAWAFYLEQHPDTNREVDIEIAKMCCPECSGQAPSADSEKKT